MDRSKLQDSIEPDKKIQEPIREDEDQFYESMRIDQTPQRMPSMQGENKQKLIQIKTPAPFLGQRMPSLMSQQSQRTPARGPMQRQTTPIMVGADFSKIGSVSSIECPGPGKQLILNKMGIVSPTGVSLTAEEINDIMKEISRRTRIPINQGLFKTAFDNLILTAVVSEFVGTRFLIERMPMMPPPGYPQRRSVR